jgi:hypothetical protein
VVAACALCGPNERARVRCARAETPCRVPPQVAHNPPWSGIVGTPTVALLGNQHPVPHEILYVAGECGVSMCTRMRRGG